jgi:fructokinase
LQLDKKSPTGTVKVQVFEDGQPKFQIAENVAWDNFEWTSQWQALAARTAAVCFGSLAQRSDRSRTAIRLFLQNLRPNAVKIFDVNLRESFFSADILRESAKSADIMKVNEDELSQVVQLLGYKPNAKEAAASWLLRTCGLKLVCVTEGARGSSLVAADGVHRHPGFPTEVADTVGAGDAFTAALIHHYLRGATLDEMNEAANRMGSWVASQVGATPKPDVKLLKSILHSSVQQLD